MVRDNGIQSGFRGVVAAGNGETTNGMKREYGYGRYDKELSWISKGK